MARPRPESTGSALHRGRFALAACVLAVGALTACAPLPPRPAEEGTAPAAEPAERGPLAELGERLEAGLPGGESAFWLLEDSADSLRVRLALADLAAETLDIQYFIWQDDMTGRLLTQQVLEAADRGVRVRLLLDDLAVAGRDDELAGLHAHPRIEVRVFNPWRARMPLGRPLEFVFRMGVLNHRMHNKVFVADGRFGILGGRNIGDRYFGVYERFVQHDVDLMVAGPLLEDLRRSFEVYWDAELSYALFERRDGEGLLAGLREICAASTPAREPMLAAFAPPRDGGWARYFDAFVERAASGGGELYLDAPSVHHEEPDQLYARFMSLLARAEDELVLSSPYLVPDDEFIALVEALVERGVDVTILTNSLASNSHVIAHSAYKQRRRALLSAGAEVYEMRADARALERYSTPPVEPEWLALHTKAAVIDARWSFIGSPNVDPRSMILNTEIGAVVDDPQLAGDLLTMLRRDIEPENAWRVTLDEDGWLKWHNGDETRARQPAKGFQQRAVEFFMNLLPIKNQA